MGETSKSNQKVSQRKSNVQTTHINANQNQTNSKMLGPKQRTSSSNAIPIKRASENISRNSSSNTNRNTQSRQQLRPSRNELTKVNNIYSKTQNDPNLISGRVSFKADIHAGKKSQTRKSHQRLSRASSSRSSSKTGSASKSRALTLSRKMLDHLTRSRLKQKSKQKMIKQRSLSNTESDMKKLMSKKFNLPMESELGLSVIGSKKEFSSTTLLGDEETDEDEDKETEEDLEDDADGDDENEEDEDEEEEVASTEGGIIHEELVNRYIQVHKEYMHLVKTNAYLQDRLYQICVRKGIIVETALENKRENRGKKKKNLAEKLKSHFEAAEEDVDDDEPKDDNDFEAILRGTEPKHLGRDHTAAHSLEFLKSIESHQSIPHTPIPFKIDLDSVPPSHASIPRIKEVFSSGTDGFRHLKRVHKYQKIINHIHNLEKTKDQLVTVVDHRIEEMKVENQNSALTTEKLLQEFISQIRSYSRECVHTGTGKHLDTEETELYITEINKLFTKLCKTILEFYKNWHEINFALKRLEETGSHGDKAFEYEQLCGENKTLQEKVEYRELELEKAKGKITHAIQLLAHIKEKKFKVEQNIDDGTINLAIVNKRIQKLITTRERATQKCMGLKQEEKVLQAKSYMISNPRLLKDFEKTNKTVTKLQQQKTKIREQLHLDHIAINTLKKRIESHKQSASSNQTTSSSSSTFNKLIKKVKPQPGQEREKYSNVGSNSELNPKSSANSVSSILNESQVEPVSKLSSRSQSQPQPASTASTQPLELEQLPDEQQPPPSSVRISENTLYSQNVKNLKKVTWNWKTQKLLELLEKRHNEPWKQVRKQIQITTPANNFNFNTPGTEMIMRTISC